MESTGVPGRIQMSLSTATLVRDSGLFKAKAEPLPPTTSGGRAAAVWHLLVRGSRDWDPVVDAGGVPGKGGGQGQGRREHVCPRPQPQPGRSALSAARSPLSPDLSLVHPMARYWLRGQVRVAGSGHSDSSGGTPESGAGNGMASEDGGSMRDLPRTTQRTLLESAQAAALSALSAVVAHSSDASAAAAAAAEIQRLRSASERSGGSTPVVSTVAEGSGFRPRMGSVGSVDKSNAAPRLSSSWLDAAAAAAAAEPLLQGPGGAPDIRTTTWWVPPPDGLPAADSPPAPRLSAETALLEEAERYTLHTNDLAEAAIDGVDGMDDDGDNNSDAAEAAVGERVPPELMQV